MYEYVINVWVLNNCGNNIIIIIIIIIIITRNIIVDRQPSKIWVFYNVTPCFRKKYFRTAWVSVTLLPIELK